MQGKAQADLGARQSSGDWLKIYLDQRRTQERLSKPFAQGAEKLCKKKARGNGKPLSKKNDPFMDDVIDRLQKKYSTKVEIKNKSINIKYNDVEDLNRILEIMGLIED